MLRAAGILPRLDGSLIGLRTSRRPVRRVPRQRSQLCRGSEWLGATPYNAALVAAEGRRVWLVVMTLGGTLLPFRWVR